MLDEINKTVTGSFRSDKASTPVNTLTGKHTSKLVLQFLVGTEKVADLSSTGPNITSYPSHKKKSLTKMFSQEKKGSTWDIRVATNMAEQFTHESSAEPSYFLIGLSFWIKVGPALSASHIQSGKSILEGLLEAEEFQDGQVD